MGGKGSGGWNKKPIEQHRREGTYRPYRHDPKRKKKKQKQPPKLVESNEPKVIKIFRRFKQTKGEWAGKPLELEPWQKDFIVPLFNTFNPDGTRQYRTCYVEIPRKNGKSTLAAGVADYLLLEDNEPGAEIYIAANDRDQAGIIFNECTAFIEQDAEYNDKCRMLPSTKRVIIDGTYSLLRAVSAEAYTKWGYNPHGIIYDELHAAPNRDLWDVLTTAQGTRRQPLIFVITTAGYDRNSICWELHDYACKVRDGIIDDPTFLPVIYAAPEDADWTDEKVWHDCNPALGVFRSLDEMRNQCKKAQETPALEMVFRRLYLNQWTSSVERWMPMDRWDRCSSSVDEGELQGKPCYCGLDLAATTDLTALSLVFPGENGYDVLMRFWIPGARARDMERRDRVPYALWASQGFITLTEGDLIDYQYICEELKRLREMFDIKEIAYDTWGATKLVQDLTEEGFIVVPFRQGDKSMSPPTKELMNVVLGERLHHGGHPILRWNADNMVVTMGPTGLIKPDKAKATQKIDGMVALIMALDRATRHTEETSIYEERGFDSI